MKIIHSRLLLQSDHIYGDDDENGKAKLVVV